MDVVPRIFGVALVALALAVGSGGVQADDIVPGNGDLESLPVPPARSAQDSLLPTDNSSSFGLLAQKLGIQNGRLDFFSVRPESGTDLKQLMPSQAVPGGGVKLQFKW
jgi:hypothetical protein